MTLPDNGLKGPPPSNDPGSTPKEPSPIAEPVYAPASERVPKTVEEYRDVVNHPDTDTPERQATATSTSEPSFTRVQRPTNTSESETSWDTSNSAWLTSDSGGSPWPKRLGVVALGVAGGTAVWLWMRWRRERNKPINRFRRQARQAADRARERASTLREQMPELPEFPYEARRPAVGLGTALLSLAIVMWQQSRARSREELARSEIESRSRQARKFGKRAVDTVSDVDWMQRLQQLKELWNPGRVELEKVSIPRRH
jgi:hypothetical protein